MFQSLRVGSPLYILYKSEGRMSEGEVVSVGEVRAKYDTVLAQGQFQPPKMVVDITANVEGEVMNLKDLPADLGIADFGKPSVVVADNKDLMLNEVNVLKNVSQRILDSVDFHTGIVEKCEDIERRLTPNSLAKDEMIKIKSDIAVLQDDIGDIKDMLTRALKRKD